MKSFPNPFISELTFDFKVNQSRKVSVRIYDARGTFVAIAFEGVVPEGDFRQTWNGSKLASGLYVAQLCDTEGNVIQSTKLIKTQ